MFHRRTIMGTLAVMMTGWPSGLLAAQVRRRAFEPGAVWPDNDGIAINAHGGGILERSGRYYWFGEHKVAGKLGNSAQVGVHVYSSEDLYNWRDDGIALRVDEDPSSDIVRGCIIERPKVLFNKGTGKFVMWFHLEKKGEGYGTARAGVAVADCPQGPYTFIRSIRPNAGYWPVNVTAADKIPGEENFLERDLQGGQMARDMTLFLDDDGHAYLIASSEENQTLHVSQLSEDFLDFSGVWSRAVPNGGNEAPAIFKRGGRYYMITSGLTGWAPNAARSFVADNILGEWTALGNPIRGTTAQMSTTFGGQSTFVLPYKGRYIFMADQWRPENPIDGRYLWLPIEWVKDRPVINWKDRWTF